MLLAYFQGEKVADLMYLAEPVKIGLDSYFYVVTVYHTQETFFFGEIPQCYRFLENYIRLDVMRHINI